MLVTIYFVSVLIVLIFMLIEYNNNINEILKEWQCNLLALLFPVLNTAMAIVCLVLFFYYKIKMR